ncbi:DUF2156 domain-containing protein [Pseudonocardiaceae bacterium YIM PH 21723]|nr:DUF2156 domain-containing protein [Pseudonocardiaceae bacterium YIM PH 21723]
MLQAPKRWRLDGIGTVRAITWATRVVGLLLILSIVLPFGRRKLREPVGAMLDLPIEATLAALLIGLAAGVGLWMLAASLRRRKRRAWQLAVILCVVVIGLHVFFRHGPFVIAAVTVLLICLITTRKHFIAYADPVVGKWSAVIVFTQLIGAGVLLNLGILWAAHRKVAGTPTFLEKLQHALLALVGITGPIEFTNTFLDDLTALVGIAFSIGAVLLAGYFLLRSAEPSPGLSAEDQDRIRELLGTHGGRDSLGYFALRRDKSVVFSPTGKSAITYRVLAGTALASGDPLGDVEAWPGAIEEFLDLCRRHAWVPAAIGCSERAATVWSRHGLDALELGDEAVVDAGAFSLDGRPMRGVRQAVNRVKRSGYEVRVCRGGQLAEDKRAAVAGLADHWRGSETERGYSMALSRFADPADPECVVVTAERAGEVGGVLQFVPWGPDGLSLDMMRRDSTIPDNGLNELMISELLLACGDLGVRQVSLNFAMFRAALERGERIGAGPVARVWARLLRIASRWWQIESLYRFNEKFRPLWIPRYVVFPAVRDLPRIALACMEAEGFGGRPPALLRLLRK